MASPSGSHRDSRAPAEIAVTVVRGHTDQVTQVFELGRAAEELQVGAGADWRVAGPGVVARHLRLRFDGHRLYAASADGTTYVNGATLKPEWTPLVEGAELRFGFALLRVGEPAQGARPPGPRTRGPRPVRWAALGAGLATLVALAGAIAHLTGSDDPSPEALASSATKSSSAPAAADSATPRAEPARAPEPALSFEASPSPAPVEAPAALVQLSPALGATANEGAASPLLGPQHAYPQNVANRPIPRIGEQPWLIAEDWRKHHERQLRSVGRAGAKVIFLGDSITEGWGASAPFREHFAQYTPLNLGLAGDTTQNVLWRLAHGALDGTHPSAIVTMVGINNLAGGFTPEATADGVRAIVSSLREHAPDARVLLLSILPARQKASDPLRARILTANRLLANLAQPGRVQVADVGSVLLEPDGSISKSTLRDFVHPTSEGYARLSQAVAPLLEPLVNQ